jgi:hypothetical protein
MRNQDRQKASNYRYFEVVRYSERYSASCATPPRFCATPLLYRPFAVSTEGLAEDGLPASWLVVGTTRSGALVYEAGWRHRSPDGTLMTMKRRLGPAWLERDGADGFRRRRGRRKPGYLDEHAAVVAKDRLVREVEHELAE